MGKVCACTPLSPPPNPHKHRVIIAKVMLLGAVAPMKFSNGVWFDGKIGIWPIVNTKVAQRTSKHRPKGTNVLVPAMVGGERYKKLIIEEVTPATKACIPRPEGHTIFVQQDWAILHTKVGIMEAMEEAAGGDIVIETQLTNSSDINFVDLGSFHSIHQLKGDVGVTNTQELVEATTEAFYVYPRETLERI
ncbi:unnamed protein product [Discosporangium mesarthrocarpum]